MTQINRFLQIYLILLLFYIFSCRIHKPEVKNDGRKKIDLTTFGFLKGGELVINVASFSYALEHEGGDDRVSDLSFGFTLDKTKSYGISPDIETKEQTCILTQENKTEDSIVFFDFELQRNPPRIRINRTGDLQDLAIAVPTKSEEKAKTRKRRSLEFLSDSYLFSQGRVKRQAEQQDEDGTTTVKVTEMPTTTALKVTEKPTTTLKVTEKPNPKEVPTTAPTSGTVPTTTTAVEQNTPTITEAWKPVNDTIPLSVVKDVFGRNVYSAKFVVWIKNDTEEGLYNLFFHNCENYGKDTHHKLVNFTVYLQESNYEGKNYLSAGEIPMPAIFAGYCVLYFLVAIFWWMILRRATEGVFKTHYLMLVFLFVKAISLMFHALNYHFIQIEGHHEAAFAILYYITYLMKGTFLFVTIVLVGAGWAFVKHILSKRDKKIFIFVIPLQILANVAQIIIEETEEGQSQYLLWKQLFIMLDLLCCGAILFPVIWSIRHLQEASHTDGKAAINLVKLKIFRHFYIMIVCYIYFTRIIVYLIAMTVPFQFAWMCTVFKETAAFIFFVVTGYKFRPASDNPYLQIPQEDDEEEMEEVLTQSGVTESLIRVNIKDPSDNSSTTANKRESSHEYD